MLSKTSGSQNLIDAEFVKEISKSNRLVDVLLRELVKVRAGQLLTQEKVENDQQRQQKEKDLFPYTETEPNRISILNASTSDHALHHALFPTDSPKLSSRKKVEFGGAYIARHRNSDSGMKDFEDSTQNQARTSILKDKTQPQPILKTSKTGDGFARRMGANRLSEEYPNDFDEISESLANDDELNSSALKRSARGKAAVQECNFSIYCEWWY